MWALTCASFISFVWAYDFAFVIISFCFPFFFLLWKDLNLCNAICEFTLKCSNGTFIWFLIHVYYLSFHCWSLSRYLASVFIVCTLISNWYYCLVIWELQNFGILHACEDATIGFFCVVNVFILLSPILLALVDWGECGLAGFCGRPMDNCHLRGGRWNNQHIQNYKTNVLYRTTCLKGSSLSPNKSNSWLYYFPSKLGSSVYTNFRFMGWTTPTSFVGGLVEAIYQTGIINIRVSSIYNKHRS